ncbi:MAG: laminin B domain-containing protein [Phycisphaerae bacterium]
MIRSTRWMIGMAALLVPLTVTGLGCGGQGSVGLGGGSITITLGGKTVTFGFGFDPIEVRANESTGRIPFGFNNPLGGVPVNPPPTGTMRLPSSNVNTGRRLAAKGMVRAQALPLNGTATIRFYVAPGISADACDEAVLLAEFQLVLTTGTIAVLDEVFDLSAAALAVLAVNDVTICVEIIADYDGIISIGDTDIDFGSDAPDSAGFTLRNIDTVENIHILMPDEDFDASNRLTPGATRRTTLTNVSEGMVVTLRAGRNGTVLDTADCPAITGANYQAVAEWDGFGLTCSATQDAAGGDVDTGPPPGTIIQVPVYNDGGMSDPAPVTTTIGGVDYGVVGVLYDQTPATDFSTTVPDSMSVDLSELGLSGVDTLYMAIHSSFVADLPNGVDMGTLTIDYAEGGSPTTLDFVLGGNTAEWSYDRPENVPVPHDLVPTLYTFPTMIDSASEYLGREYALTLSADSSRTISCIKLTIAPGSTYSAFRDPASPTATWASQYVAAMTFEGPAGTPSTVGSCDGTTDPVGNDDSCIFDEDCPSGQVCAVDFVCVPAGGGGPDEDCSPDGVCNEDCPVSTPDPDCAEVCTADGFCNENCSDLAPDPDCTTPDGQPMCTARSDFDSGDEGWTLVGDAEGGRSDPDYNFTGGNPGAYVSADDDVTGGTWYFQAPAKYHGDFGAAYGRTLTFDLKQSSLNSQFDNRDVILTGAGMTIWFNTAMNPGTDWTAYSITLDVAAGWLANDDTPASEADIRAVLADIEDLQIRGEYVSGADTGSLDNVVLNSGCP